MHFDKEEVAIVADNGDNIEKIVSNLHDIYGSIDIIYKDGSIPHGIWLGITGEQYVDVFEPASDEIIIDAGAFDGTTEKLFYDWAGEKLKKIYAFEMDPRNAQNCKKYYIDNNLDKVKFINKGTGAKHSKVFLEDTFIGGAGSTVGKEGVLQAEITTIDSEIGMDNVTFIKMDVEGSELDSLKGAQNTIRRCKPKLAICIYHKDFDPAEISGYILKLVPEYKFIVRHYTSVFWETVLYAYVD